MKEHLSERLAGIVKALPLKKGMRVIEIGCGPGAAARAVADRIGEGYVLGIDRSEKAIQQAIKNSNAQMQSGRLSFRKVSIENFELQRGENLFDLAFAIRVGVLDGRHPKDEAVALARIAKSLTKNGKLYIDGGNPLIELPLHEYRKKSNFAILL